MKRTSLFFTFLMVLLVLCSQASGVQILVVNETEQYVPATVVSMDVSGDMSTGYLSFVMSGYTLEDGKMAKVYVAGPASTILVRDVTVNGKRVPVFFDEKGYYFIVRETPFMASGVIEGIGFSSSTSVTFPGPINRLSFDLSGGYPVGRSTYYGVVNRTVTLQLSMYKHVVQTDGVFRYTFWSEKNTYYYVLDITSFGGTIGRYEIPLRNNEMEPAVTVNVLGGGSGSSTWHVSGNTLVLDIPAERAIVTISGVLACTNCTGSTYRNPLSTPVKMVLSSDPEMEMTVRAMNAVELDVSESPVPPEHPNGRVFLVNPGGYLIVGLSSLSKLPSLAATIDHATYTLAYTRDGAVLVDASYKYKNTGLDYLRIEVPGTPLYASTQGSAIKLTTKGGHLYLALPKSSYGTSVEYMYFSSQRGLLPIDLVHLPLPNIEVPITTVETRVYLPGDYYVLHVFGADGGSDLPSLLWLVVFSIVTVAFGLTLSRDKKHLALYYVASLGLYAISPGLYALWLGLTALPFLKKKIPAEVGKTVVIVLIVVGVLAALFAGGVFLLGMLFTSGSVGSVETGVVYETAASRMLEELPLVETKSTQLGTEEGGKITVQVREGVKPVKMEIPFLAKFVSATTPLVTAERPLSVSLLVVSRVMVYLLYLAGLVCLYKLWPLVYGAYRSSFGSRGRKSE